jgi:hypothetical protein
VLLDAVAMTAHHPLWRQPHATFPFEILDRDHLCGWILVFFSAGCKGAVRHRAADRQHHVVDDMVR